MARKLALVILAVLVLATAGAWFVHSRSGSAAPSGGLRTINNTQNTVKFLCDNDKSITATFYPKNDTKVDLVLSDGRTLSVPHALSASGARYANSDETFVFWNKGNTSFVSEGKEATITYANCLVSATGL